MSQQGSISTRESIDSTPKRKIKINGDLGDNQSDDGISSASKTTSMSQSALRRGNTIEKKFDKSKSSSVTHITKISTEHLNGFQLI